MALAEEGGRRGKPWGGCGLRRPWKREAVAAAACSWGTAASRRRCRGGRGGRVAAAAGLRAATSRQLWSSEQTAAESGSGANV